MTVAETSPEGGPHRAALIFCLIQLFPPVPRDCIVVSGPWCTVHGCGVDRIQPLLMTSKTWLGRIHCELDRELDMRDCSGAEIN